MSASIRNFTQLLKSGGSKALVGSVPTPSNQRIIATPQEFNRLGQVPTDFKSIPCTALSAIYYDINCIELPLTNAEFDAICGVQRLFNCGPDLTVGTCRVTNANCGAGINAPFVALGLAIIAIPEGHGWTQPGVACQSGAALSANTICCDGMPSSVMAGPAAPAVCTHSTWGDTLSGIPDMTAFCAAHPGACCTVAHLAWGWPTWRLLEQLLTTLRLQFIVLNRWLVIDELMSLLAFYPNPTCFIGAFGDVAVAPEPEKRWTNDTMRCKGIPVTFFQTNCVIDDATGQSSQIGSTLPSQGFGSPSYSCGFLQKMWPFPTPIFFCPGYRIDIQLVPEIACDALSAMRELSVVNTLSPAAEVASPLVTTIPAGQVRLGVVLLGYECWPQAFMSLISAWVAPLSAQAQMLQGVPYVYELMHKMDQSQLLDPKVKSRLAGVLGKAPTQQ